MVDVIPQRKRQVFGNELKVISFVNFFFKRLLYIKKKKTLFTSKTFFSQKYSFEIQKLYYWWLRASSPKLVCSWEWFLLVANQDLSNNLVWTLGTLDYGLIDTHLKNVRALVLISICFILFLFPTTAFNLYLISTVSNFKPICH